MNKEEINLINKIAECLQQNGEQKTAEYFLSAKEVPDERRSKLWKVYSLTKLSKLLNDDKAQPLVKEFFDEAVKSYYNSYPAGIQNMMDYTQKKLESSIFDGNDDIISFLEDYRVAKKERYAQGKDMFEPESFAYLSFLKDISDGVFRSASGRIIERRDIEKGRLSVEKYYDEGYNNGSSVGVQ